MDEPTNHLDMETIEALGKSLLKFQVSIIILQMQETAIPGTSWFPYSR